MASITFLGAARTVTGSRHLLSSYGYRLLIDCGLYQGIKQLRLKNWESFPVPENSINSIAITHAHIDHTGFLPRLVKRGFSGNIFATPPTCDILKILLPDSARLQEEEARFANKEGFSKHAPALPLYTVEDAGAALALMSPIPYDTPAQFSENITLCYRDAGHILGSAMAELLIRENGSTIKVLFTGDLGRLGTPILQDPCRIEDTDYLVLESTYGDRLHVHEERKTALANVVTESLNRKGVLLIPAFAVERTQEILYILRILRASRDIPEIPIYIDSPMAVGVTKIFSKYSAMYDEEARELMNKGGDILAGGNVSFCETVEQSKQLNAKKGPMIVISASGMATGGRVLHHLKHRLPDPNSTVLLVGYQAEGTRGRRLQEGEKEIKIHGEPVQVRARISTIDGFSSHADYGEILEWLSHFKSSPRKIFLVHGEGEAQRSLKAKIEEKYGWTVEIPELLEEVSIK